MILLVSSLSTYLAYANILRIEQPEHLLLNSITPGKHIYRVFQEGRCVGEFKTEVGHDIDYYIATRGALRTLYGKESSRATFSSTVFFNPLGQLFEGKFEARFMQSTISAQSKGTNPLKVELHTEIAGRIYDHSFELPGPIMLEKTASDQYQVQYPQLGKINTSYFTPSLGALYQKLGLNIVRSNEDHEECAVPSVINLTPTLVELDAKLSRWNALLEATIPKEKLRP